MIVIDKRQVFSDEGKYIHKIGTDSYFKRAIVLPSQTIEEFEEVDEIPSYTKEEYDKKVEELIHEKYSLDKEAEIQRKAILTMFPNTLSEDTTEKYLTAFAEYNSYVEECKERAKDSKLYKIEENEQEVSA